MAESQQHSTNSEAVRAEAERRATAILQLHLDFRRPEADTQRVIDPSVPNSEFVDDELACRVRRELGLME